MDQSGGQMAGGEPGDAMRGSMFAGLSSEEARRRLLAVGYNELVRPRSRRLIHIVADVLREPMFVLLLGAGIIYLLLGSLEDALMLLFFVLLTILLTAAQQRKSERVLEALRDLSSPRAKVLRDGKEQRIPGREVVPGDVLLLAEGDRVPADARLFSCNDLMADESLLTGESVPVRKRAAAADELEDTLGREPGGDDQPYVYASTVLVQGSGVALVTATGPSSAVGRIGKSLASAVAGVSPLRLQTASLVRRLAVLAGSLCLALVLIYGITHGRWLDAFLAGISLAMASLPEEFPVILSVMMALGAWRISKHNVLARRLDAIETLGATTLLCTDKTGTLTENRMRVGMLYSGGYWLDVGDTKDLPEPLHEVVEIAVLASERAPFDPMERAIHELGTRTLDGTEHLHATWKLVHEYSLSPELLAMSHVWHGEGKAHQAVATKGAPEAVVDLCHLPAPEADEIARAAGKMADHGLRVLGVARAELGPGEWPERQHDIDFRFVGLVGLQDPLRSEVPEAVTLCRQAGIRVVMISGDHARTAQAIARELGLPDAVLTGAELDALPDDELRARVRGTQVFARITPQQKLRLVEAFKADGEVVAMTGDGVNDAPALKAAHIGVAMGARGTDVAREAAGLVLLKDDFSSLVVTVRLGRRIYDNLRKAMSYTLAVHIPIVGMALVPVLLGAPLLLMPAHILFLEMIIDPACSIFFEAEPEEPDVMQRPPRDPAEQLFGGRVMLNSILQGMSALAVAIAAYLWAGHYAVGENQARAFVFAALVAGNVALVLVNRSQGIGRPRARLWQGNGRNPLLRWVVLGTSAGLLAVFSVPLLRGLFHFEGSLLNLIATALAAGCAVLIINMFVRRFSGAAPTVSS